MGQDLTRGREAGELNVGVESSVGGQTKQSNVVSEERNNMDSVGCSGRSSLSKYCNTFTLFSFYISNNIFA